MKIIHSISVVALTASIALASPSTQGNTQLKSVVTMGQKSSKLLLKTLGSNMKKQMKSGGVMKALDFCSTKAYDLTEAVNQKLPNGVRVKRVSLKFRNPANAPQADEAKVLLALEKLKKQNIILPKHLVQQVSPTIYKYYKPLLIKKKVCLKCHGEIKDTDLKRTIANRYPIDKAKHYKLGDLRGAIVVTIDKSVK